MTLIEEVCDHFRNIALKPFSIVSAALRNAHALSDVMSFSHETSEEGKQDLDQYFLLSSLLFMFLSIRRLHVLFAVMLVVDSVKLPEVIKNAFVSTAIILQTD